MATQAELETLVGHAAFDDNFRQWLFKDPEGAAASLKITLSAAQAGYIHKLGPGTGDAVTKCLRGVLPGPIEPMWGG